MVRQDCGFECFVPVAFVAGCAEIAKSWCRARVTCENERGKACACGSKKSERLTAICVRYRAVKYHQPLKPSLLLQVRTPVVKRYAGTSFFVMGHTATTRRYANQPRLECIQNFILQGSFFFNRPPRITIAIFDFSASKTSP